ncbi:helix-turn-helix transcriptional regulator [Aureimonas sp. SA4125]|uniref:helix-turn-helix domain-containing protein n=1 Tax=Aureimonas sp. SA4125 TaxID=2826993 RepID=UPI001CC6AB6E|nr:helix-turn-helix transcriptional regulator [Aureimonas sp. SA4125]
MSLADNLTRLRITDGQTIEQVATATRLPPTVIAGLESGRIVSAHRAVRALARHFGVSVDTLEA